MARPMRAVLRLSPLEQRIRDVRSDLFWALDDATRARARAELAGPKDLPELEAMAKHCAKASESAARLLELVKQREAGNG